MYRYLSIVAVVVTLAAGCTTPPVAEEAAPAAPAAEPAAPQEAPSAHVLMSAADLKWMDSPAGLPPGSKLAVISGDPSQTQSFVIRAQVPAGYRVAPHWHPGDENLTVLEGTIAIGMGETFDEGAMTSLGPAGYASLPAEMRHYFLAKSAATFQVHGMGPFVVNYVNPADDPAKGTR